MCIAFWYHRKREKKISLQNNRYPIYLEYAVQGSTRVGRGDYKTKKVKYLQPAYQKNIFQKNDFLQHDCLSSKHDECLYTWCLFCGTYSFYSAVKDNFPFSFTLNITSNFSRRLKVVRWELSRWYAGHYYVRSTSSSNKRPCIQSVCLYKKQFGEWARLSITQEVNEPYSNRS